MNKTIVEVFGCIIIKSGFYEGWICVNDDIARWGTYAGTYGPNWVFGGDQSFKESNICILFPGTSKSFYGRKAFNDFQKYMLANNLIVASQVAYV